MMPAHHRHVCQPPATIGPTLQPNKVHNCAPFWQACIGMGMESLCVFFWWVPSVIFMRWWTSLTAQGSPSIHWQPAAAFTDRETAVDAEINLQTNISRAVEWAVIQSLSGCVTALMMNNVSFNIHRVSEVKNIDQSSLAESVPSRSARDGWADLHQLRLT